MDSVELTLRAHLSTETGSATEQLSDIQAFCGRIEEGSLNLKVAEALAFKNQGHFDKAMLSVAEANRDQMIAIRRIQDLMGQVRGVQYPEVVFEKFRQFEPFEIGISDADPALSVLADLNIEDDPQLKDNRLRLHDCERRIKDAEEYLSFLENRFGDGSASEEIGKAVENVTSLARTLTDLRIRVLEKILTFVGEFLKEMPSGIERDHICLELSRNIFLVVMSPILTKPAPNIVTEL